MPHRLARYQYRSYDITTSYFSYTTIVVARLFVCTYINLTTGKITKTSTLLKESNYAELEAFHAKKNDHLAQDIHTKRIQHYLFHQPPSQVSTQKSNICLYRYRILLVPPSWKETSRMGGQQHMYTLMWQLRHPYYKDYNGKVPYKSYNIQ